MMNSAFNMMNLLSFLQLVLANGADNTALTLVYANTK